MKKHLPLHICLFVCLLLTTTVAKAQYVTIPDPYFVTFLLNNGFQECLDQNQLDTTCQLVINKTRMYTYEVDSIINYEGVQYFPNLQYLLIYGGNWSTIIPAWPRSVNHVELDNLRYNTLPALPATLDSLDMDNPWDVPVLPAGLTYLSYTDDFIDSLPVLPPTLATLSWMPWDSITFQQALPGTLTNLSLFTPFGIPLDSLPALPNNLRELTCDHAVENLPAHLPDSLRLLGISQCGISYMPTLPNWLDTFECNINNLTALPAFPATLQYIDCSENQITGPVPNLPGGLMQLYCNANQFSTIGTLPNGLQYLYCDHNQLTYLPSLPNSLQQIKCGNNLLTSLPDLPGYLDYFECDSNLNLYCFPQLGYIGDLSFYQTPIACLPDYGSVGYSNPSFSSIPLCSFLNPHNCPSYWNVSGKTFFDHNSNCIVDTGEKVFGAPVKIMSNGVLQQEIVPGDAGLFSFQLPSGNYQLLIDTGYNFPFQVNCPDTNSYQLSIDNTSLDTAQNFGITCKPGFDLAVYYIGYWAFKPANNTIVSLFAGDFANFYGLQCLSGIGGTVTVTFNGPVTYVSPFYGSLNPSLVSGDSIVWNVSDFADVNAGTSFNFVLQTAKTAAEYDEVCITATVTTPTTGDNNPSNNTLTQCTYVITSHDPNEKTVYPSGDIDTSSQWLTYTIFFQNTGTDTAHNIWISDTLSSNVDISSFQYLSSSVKTNPIIQINADRIATFNFPNINLPDTSTNEPQSQAYVQYRVKTVPNLSLGAQIQNTAYIYFDFNAAVATNTATNTVAVSTGIAPLSISKGLGLRIFPNPATQQLFISPSGFTPKWITIYDLNGQTVSEQKFASQLDISQLTDGIYFIEVKNENAVARSRFVKM